MTDRSLDSSLRPLRRRVRVKAHLVLRWRIVGILLLASLLPLALAGFGSWVVFGRLLMQKTMEHQRSVVLSHAAAIDLYLAERLRALELMAQSHTRAGLSHRETLQKIFAAFNRSYPQALVDLGVIDTAGKHVAYVGPYDLMGKDYSRAHWFRLVKTKGAYVSDVFLGYRQIVHCVIAVLRQEKDESWILRATINSDSFDQFVRLSPIASTGDAFIINRQGRYQTPARRGTVLSRSPLRFPLPLSGVEESRVKLDQRHVLQVATSLNQGRWILVVQQDESTIKAPVNRAMLRGALVALMSFGLVVITTILATWHLTRRIDRATEQRDKLQRDLLRSAKLASLGELSTGLAHEINNPLGIISAEQTNILDQLEELSLKEQVRQCLNTSIDRVRRQVKRCGGITAKMLQFGRKTEAQLRPTHLEPLLKESIQLLKRQALVRNIDLQLEIELGLPQVVLDGNELEQVMVNLINNAMYAVSGKGAIWVTACREGDEVILSVRDTGCGIPADQVERIFRPFYTTKPVGQGTGLGLSVCFGIVRSWGGSISVESEADVGTEMALHLPIHSGAAPVAPTPAHENLTGSSPQVPQVSGRVTAGRRPTNCHAAATAPNVQSGAVKGSASNKG